MTLTIAAVQPHPLTGTQVIPFQSAVGFTKHWWVKVDSDRCEWFTFSDGEDQEVARAQMEPGAQVGSQYRDVHPPPGGFTEIVFFEIHEDRRRQGFGHQAIALLQQEYPGTPMAAFSEEADQFWAALGWRRHEHRTEPRNRILFLSPDAT